MTRVKTAIASVVALAAALTLVVAPSASAADRQIQLFMERTARSTVDLGASGPSIGDGASARGIVTRTRNGKRIGFYIWTATTVGIKPGGKRETRQGTFRISLKGGDMYLIGIHEAKAGGLPDTVTRYVVVGGDGVYTGAAGSAAVRPLSPTTGYQVDIRLVSRGE